MSTYAIGDVQGQYDALSRLIDACRFDPARDRLWFVGDLVNRGPQSAATLRLVRSLGSRAVTVLGNHDLHLLAVAEGAAPIRDGDTFADVLDAPDRDVLLGWLRRECRLMHVENGFAMVHAGLLPQWTIATALRLAGEVEVALRDPAPGAFFAHLYGNRPDRWANALAGPDRLRVVVNALTRMRICTPQGRMEFRHKAGGDAVPAGYLPWFDVPGRASADHTLVCGHWSALGLLLRDDLLALDSGCVWGGPLSAVRLEDRRLFQAACEGAGVPGQD